MLFIALSGNCPRKLLATSLFSANLPVGPWLGFLEFSTRLKLDDDGGAQCESQIANLLFGRRETRREIHRNFNKYMISTSPAELRSRGDETC